MKTSKMERRLEPIHLQITHGIKTDEEGAIGYDPPLRTFFLQAFPHPKQTTSPFGLAPIWRSFQPWNPPSRPRGHKGTKFAA
jgi:hypothetical protein